MSPQPSLFLAIERDQPFEEALQSANPHLVKLLIGQKVYLEEIELKGRNYLGKHSPSQPTLDELEDLEKHLISLLNRLTPRYAFLHNRPMLLTLFNNDTP